MKPKIGILGSGMVANALAEGFVKHGYSVMLGSRESQKNDIWIKSVGLNAKSGSFSETAAFGEILVNAIKGANSVDALGSIDVSHLKGKIIIDASNPIVDNPPLNGMVQFFTKNNDSLMEQLQKSFPESHFVKAFSCVGSAFMVNPAFKEKPSMFICGNNTQAKKAVGIILEEFGWEVEDMGVAEAARVIEPLCILWCLPGFLNNDWAHAFRLIRL